MDILNLASAPVISAKQFIRSSDVCILSWCQSWVDMESIFVFRKGCSHGEMLINKDQCWILCESFFFSFLCVTHPDDSFSWDTSVLEWEGRSKDVNASQQSILKVKWWCSWEIRQNTNFRIMETEQGFHYPKQMLIFFLSSLIWTIWCTHDINDYILLCLQIL